MSAPANHPNPSDNRWERDVPVYGFPVINGFFIGLCVLILIAFVLTGYRELAGLGPVSGMNDAFGWGIWKTFNVMVLTALGSGAFAIGISAWVFRRKRMHALMRMALLTSFLAYACGLLLLGIDAGRPWNFYWIVFPWKWNMHSPLAEVAICMSIYAMIPLAVENIPPVLERLWYFDSRLRPGVERVERRLHAFYPWIIAAAYLLPGMHQSSLGALMLLAGERVHPLWQTPWLPLLYLGAAAFMSFGCVAGTTMLCCVVWKRAMDMDVLDEAANITWWLIFGWLGLRFIDIIARGAFGTAFHFDRFAGVFWLETILIAGGGWLLIRSVKNRDLQAMFIGYVLSSAGGMLYRFSPTTLAFRPNPEALYFPATIEILVSLGFISLGIAGFLIAVKRLAILPAPLYEWHNMANYFRFRRPYIRWTGYFKYGYYGENESETPTASAD
ncbi:MAG TPA: Ni/Fe-hydrogenase cytochrome b subunit [Terriglobales bacterium]|nr:Ni/Fe-hydrogenase cytochrome b subunit [Terriglobales bacterium]